MVTLQLTDEQVADLIQQLSPERQQAILELVHSRRWAAWEAAAPHFEAGARQAAAVRGRDWDTMSEEEREDFVVDVVHEDHRCSS